MNKAQQKRYQSLYQQHVNALHRQGKSKSTIDIYSRAVRRVTEYFDRCPDRLTTDDLKNHFSNLVNTHSWSTVKVDRNGLQFFYKHVLDKDWKWVDIVKPPIVKSLPDILTPSEISLMINATRQLRYQTYILTVYSMGLRLGEALNLKVGDIDADSERLHPINGTGAAKYRRNHQHHGQPPVDQARWGGVMMDLTAVIERYHGRFRDQYAARMTTDQHSALNAVLGCRSAQYGEMLLDCSSCHWQQTRFHSCGHRSCHRCQNHDTTGWLERQSQKLLPVEYFMVTFTLPYELRALAWQHQAQVYGILFDCAVSTLKDFGANDKKLGARMGMTAVLHTHSRALNYHPHVHLVVPGGCLNHQRRQWEKLRGKYLFNEFALAEVFRARVLESLLAAGLTLPDAVPAQWVADCAHVGKGLPALKYLSRYLYRGVMNEKNLIADDGTYVTFRYQDSQSGVTKTRRIKGETFLWLLFQHVLPKGFRRVRDYGFLHGNAKSALRVIQRALGVWVTLPQPRARTPFRCHLCKQPMSIVGFKPPAWRSG